MLVTYWHHMVFAVSYLYWTPTHLVLIVHLSDI